MMPEKRRAKLKPDEQESAAIAQTQLEFFFANHEEAAAQTNRTSESPQYRDPGDQARRRRA
jgi:hypothetical protein